MASLMENLIEVLNGESSEYEGLLKLSQEKKEIFSFHSFSVGCFVKDFSIIAPTSLFPQDSIY